MKHPDEIREVCNYLEFFLSPPRGGMTPAKSHRDRAEIQLATLRWAIDDMSDSGAQQMQQFVDNMHATLKKIGKPSIFLPE